ncbi:hypothetical protein GCM10010420_07260 [Streptomyces glaucosporus]|uniref:Uncharacterized protein n=1 Tax=Streptomyces glaucosporus TaxID=284044 RepID=A0ABN3HS99_9ACTN
MKHTVPIPGARTSSTPADVPAFLDRQGGAAITAPGQAAALLAAYLYRDEDADTWTTVAVYSDGLSGAELDVAAVDELLASIEAFVPRLRAMRAALAEAEGAGR